jgi:hypothetical protein
LPRERSLYDEENYIMRIFTIFRPTLIKYYHVLKTRRMTWVGHIASMGVVGNAYKILVGKTQGSEHLGDPGVDERVILKFIFKKLCDDVDWLQLPQDNGQ